MSLIRQLQDGTHPRRVAWCVEHLDLAWMYSDGGGSCLYDCQVEGALKPCRLILVSLNLPNGTPWGRRP